MASRVQPEPNRDPTALSVSQRRPAAAATVMETSPTKLAYFDDMWILESGSTLISHLQEEDGRRALILDSTIFHPQGGGQPADTGFILSVNSSFKFVVEDVRLKDGVDSTIRIVKFGDNLGCPCGGTHVADIANIGSLKGLSLLMAHHLKPTTTLARAW